LPVDVAHRAGNLNLALGADLLHDQLHGKQRREVVRPDRLLGAGMQHWGGGGDGRSAMMLYQCFGIFVSSSRYFTLSLM